MRTPRPAPAACPPALRDAWQGIQEVVTEAVERMGDEDRTWLVGRLSEGAKVGIIAGDELLMAMLVSPNGEARPLVSAVIADLMPAAKTEAAN